MLKKLSRRTQAPQNDQVPDPNGDIEMQELDPAGNEIDVRRVNEMTSRFIKRARHVDELFRLILLVVFVLLNLIYIAVVT